MSTAVRVISLLVAAAGIVVWPTMIARQVVLALPVVGVWFAAVMLVASVVILVGVIANWQKK